MVVSYNSSVFTSSGQYGLFLRLLSRWKGSIYKLIWPDFMLYSVLYFMLSCLYRLVLNESQRQSFENVALYCGSFANYIPLTFVLGFYVSLVIQRWWSQFLLVPWPDNTCVWISVCIHGQDERGRLMRRTIVRYLNLAFILGFRLMCLPVMKRFPTLDHLVEAGILLEEEKAIFDQFDQVVTHPKYWMPLVWAGSIATRARKEGRVRDDMALKTLIDKLCEFRTGIGTLLGYDWVNVPLVYTQVVTLAVYSFFLTTLMGRQFLDPTKGYDGHDIDLYVPLFTLLQFFFYMGWLKVAEAMINPFGEDDDDFDINWMIDRNLTVSYLIVDEMHQEHPNLTRDQFWEDAFPELPYTAEAEEVKTEIVIGAATQIGVKQNLEFLPRDSASNASRSRRGSMMPVSLAELEDIKEEGEKSPGKRRGSFISIPIPAMMRRKSSASPNILKKSSSHVNTAFVNDSVGNRSPDMKQPTIMVTADSFTNSEDMANQKDHSQERRKSYREMNLYRKSSRPHIGNIRKRKTSVQSDGGMSSEQSEPDDKLDNVEKNNFQDENATLKKKLSAIESLRDDILKEIDTDKDKSGKKDEKQETSEHVKRELDILEQRAKLLREQLEKSETLSNDSLTDEEKKGRGRPKKDSQGSIKREKGSKDFDETDEDTDDTESIKEKDLFFIKNLMLEDFPDDLATDYLAGLNWRNSRMMKLTDMGTLETPTTCGFIPPSIQTSLCPQSFKDYSQRTLLNSTMTVSYNSRVFTSSGQYGLFLRLLGRWKGSIYKLIWPDLMLYAVFYFLLSCLYRLVLNESQREIFENVSRYCDSFADYIPLTFVLGFYVSLVIQRWWDQFMTIPWPDNTCVWISVCIHGQDERGRLMRRTIVRYLSLSFILGLRLMCLPVMKRFPTLDHLVEAGILLEEEKAILDQFDQVVSHPKYWMPLVWAGSIATRARKEGRVRDDMALKTLVDKICEFRAGVGMCLGYDWINVPLVYTQVVTLAVYTFFLTTLMGRQFLDTSKGYKGHDVDLYVPFFTLLQFFFYMGWLKVAEAMINPFGEDDDDFDVNWMIDRNLQVSYLIVDEMHQEHPNLTKDQFWDEAFPELPYTAAAEEVKTDIIIGAATQVDIKPNLEFLPRDSVSNASRSRRGSMMPSTLAELEDIKEEGEGSPSRRRNSFISIPIPAMFRRKSSISPNIFKKRPSHATTGSVADDSAGSQSVDTKPPNVMVTADSLTNMEDSKNQKDHNPERRRSYRAMNLYRKSSRPHMGNIRKRKTSTQSDGGISSEQSEPDDKLDRLEKKNLETENSMLKKKLNAIESLRYDILKEMGNKSKTTGTEDKKGRKDDQQENTEHIRKELEILEQRAKLLREQLERNETFSNDSLTDDENKPRGVERKENPETTSQGSARGSDGKGSRSRFVFDETDEDNDDTDDTGSAKEKDLYFLKRDQKKEDEHQ